MTRKDALDIDAVHRYLWKKANRQGKITFLRTAVAKELGVTVFTVSRIMTQMQAENRAFKMMAAYRSGCTFRLVDPDEWELAHEA